MRRRLRLVLPIAVSLAGCASAWPSGSYVQLRDPADAAALADGLATFVALRLRSGSRAVALDPTPGSQASNAVTPALASALRRRGFAVAEDATEAAPDAHRIAYLVTPLDEGSLVRVTIDGSTAGARFFGRNAAGGLQPGGPFTVTQAAR